MKTRIPFVTQLVLLLILLSSCSSGDSTPPTLSKGDRLLGMDIVSITPALNFDATIAKAKAAGAQFITLAVLWNQVNTSGTNYDSNWVTTIKTIASYCAANGLKLSLTIWTVDTTGKHVPADLLTTRFEDTPHTMANRFVALLDKLFITEGIAPSLLTSIQIGNELDTYNSAADTSFSWSDYGAFLYQVKLLKGAKSYAAIPVGFTGTLYGLNEQKAVFTALAGVVDIVGVTYYPQNIDFTVKDPSVVITEIATLVSNYSTTGKPLYIQEAGYQSGSASCNSSQDKQSQFVRNIFTAWDTHSSSIKAVAFLRMNDVSPAAASATATQYGLANIPAFVEYIETLGLVAYDGTVKSAYQTLADNARARGW